jgi:hypothetical protein
MLMAETGQTAEQAPQPLQFSFSVNKPFILNAPCLPAGTGIAAPHFFWGTGSFILLQLFI